MTRARIAAYGVGSPPPLQRWLNAVLLLCVSLVQGVAAMFGMRKRNKDRDWHTNLEPETLPQTKSDNQFKETLGPPGPCLAALKRSESRPAVHAQRRTQTLTRLTTLAISVRQEADVVRVARGGGHPVLRTAQTRSHGSTPTRADQAPALILSLSKDAGGTVVGVVRLKSA